VKERGGREKENENSMDPLKKARQTIQLQLEVTERDRHELIQKKHRLRLINK